MLSLLRLEGEAAASAEFPGASRRPWNCTVGGRCTADFATQLGREAASADAQSERRDPAVRPPPRGADITPRRFISPPEGVPEKSKRVGT